VTIDALVNDLVRLEPLDARHAAGLATAAAIDRSNYLLTSVPDGMAAAEEYVTVAAAARTAGTATPFAVVLASSGRVVGSTRIFDYVWFGPPDGPPQAAEIGHTWYAADVQRTGVNTACKLLLLTHVFETWHSVRITLKTDARNARSRAAIERIGARFEGIRRAHQQAADGRIRDTAYYSIVSSEWPQVRATLERRR
jgi:RimJ/RimL family protein N-acetyltransferase